MSGRKKSGGILAPLYLLPGTLTRLSSPHPQNVRGRVQGEFRFCHRGLSGRSRSRLPVMPAAGTRPDAVSSLTGRAFRARYCRHLTHRRRNAPCDRRCARCSRSGSQVKSKIHSSGAMRHQLSHGPSPAQDSAQQERFWERKFRQYRPERAPGPPRGLGAEDRRFRPSQLR